MASPDASSSQRQPAIKFLASHANITMIVSFLTLLSSIIFYVYNVDIAIRAQEAVLFNTVHTEYAAPEMLESLQIIQSSIDEHGYPGYAAVYASAKRDRSPQYKELDHARRRLTNWFSKLVYFHEFRLLPPKYLNVFPGEEKARTFIRLVEPLAMANRAISGRNVSNVFAHVRALYNIPQRYPLDQSHLSKTPTKLDGVCNTLRHQGPLGSGIAAAMCKPAGLREPATSGPPPAAGAQAPEAGAAVHVEADGRMHPTH